MMEFFKLIRKNSAEIGSQNGARMRQLQASSRAQTCTGQLGRPTGTRKSRLDTVDRSIDRVLGSVERPIDRQAYLGADLFLLTGFRLRF